MEEKIKVKPKCRKCGQELIPVPRGFDISDIFCDREMVYCDNPQCEMYRIVVIIQK